MSGNALFIYSAQEEKYAFGNEHPFNPLRLRLTVDLMDTMGGLYPEDIVEPVTASKEELAHFHDPAYISVVEKLGKNLIPTDAGIMYGLGTEDNPIFSNMHDVTSLVVGATLTGARLIMQGKTEHALNIAGGLHHAQRAMASGFCIYNDISVAISWLQRNYGARIMYLDTDAHHGDGVQWAFYDDPTVLTISIHETGRYLFPGTGGINERGRNEGYGFKVNMPLEAYTEDDSFLEVFDMIVPPLAEAFKPDIIISQNGCDAHALDPLTHLWATTKIYSEIPARVHSLAHKYAKGKWLAVGGGGYDPFRVVPRAWTLLWAKMTDRKLMDEVHKAWLEKWQRYSSYPLPRYLLDLTSDYKPIPRREEITEKNRQTAQKVVRDALSAIRNYWDE